MANLVKKGINKYMSLPQAVRASFWSMICIATQRGVTLLSTPIFTRLLTREQYGVFTVYQSWYTILVVFATLNLYGGVYNNGLLKFEKNRNRFTSSIQGLSTTLTFGLFIVYLCAHDFFNEMLGLSTIYVLAMFVEFLFFPAYHFWANREKFSYRYHKLIAATMVIAFGSPILGIISVMATEYKAEARVLSFVFVQVAVGLFFYIFNMARGKVFFDKKIWKYALLFNIPLIPHYLSYMLLQQADRIMISKMLGQKYAAMYGVAYAIAMMMNIVNDAVNTSFVPYTYKALRRKDFKSIGKNANMLLIMIGLGCMLAIAFSPEIIMIFAEESYSNAQWIMPPVAASAYFMFMYSLFCNIEFYYEKNKFVTVATCTGAVANVILNYIFIQLVENYFPGAGYYAAGYTTLACYMILALAHYFFHKRVIKEKEPQIKRIYNMRFILFYSLVVLVAMVVITLLYPYRYVRYAIILAIVIAAIIKRKWIIGIFKDIKKKA